MAPPATEPWEPWRKIPRRFRALRKALGEPPKKRTRTKESGRHLMPNQETSPAIPAENGPGGRGVAQTVAGGPLDATGQGEG
jgi:hypothetical protein